MAMLEPVAGQRTTKQYLPTAFVSDVHLGSRYCQAERFLSFLDTHHIDDLYLVGDMIDGWRLRRRWWWPAVYHRILQRLMQMQAHGTRLYYTPGNHDEFLRHHLRDYGFIQVADEFTHETIQGGRMLVMHGDQFDRVESNLPWLSMMGAGAYERVMGLNQLTNQVLRRLGVGPVQFSSELKKRVKRMVKSASRFEEMAANHARERDCDGIILGHVHAPSVRRLGDMVVCNTGDWVEHCTALIEHEDGSWELKEFLPNGQRSIEVTSDGKDLLQHVGRRARACGQSGGNCRQLPASA